MPDIEDSVKDIAVIAIGAQDACNASGVVHCLAATMTVLWRQAHLLGTGTTWVNHHPFVVLYADKLADLCGIKERGIKRFGWAYDWCKARAAEGGTFDYIEGERP